MYENPFVWVARWSAHSGCHDWVNILGDHVEKLREVFDKDIHQLVLKFGKVQLHVHRADHFLEGHSPHDSY